MHTEFEPRTVLGGQSRQEQPRETPMRIVLAAVLLAASAAYAQEVKIGPDDSVHSILVAQKGKRVSVRLSGGPEVTGIVRDATSRLVVLGAVSGREFFDAVVPLERVEAVLIRTRQQ